VRAVRTATLYDHRPLQGLSEPEWESRAPKTTGNVSHVHSVENRGTRGTRHTARADAVLWSCHSAADLGMSPYLTILIGVAMIGFAYVGL
jgi:hypothetical protein